MFTKVFALVLIIVAGLTYAGFGNIKRFENIWQGTITDPGRIAVAFYSGIFSYSGWWVLLMSHFHCLILILL